METMMQHCGRRMRGVQEARMRLIGRGIVIGLCALACFVALSLHTERVAAAGYTVNVTTDSGTPGDLRDAITQVNNSTDPGNTITITATGTITLTSALPYLSKNVAITGPGAALLTVQAATTPKTANYGVFAVTLSVTASIANLTIANGNSFSDVPGSGILNQNGTLTVTNTTFAGNSAGNFNVGGGIYNDGTLTVTNSIFSGNSAGDSGGGIFNFRGAVTVTNSTFFGNNAKSGGGIYNDGTLTVTNSIFFGNNAKSGGGIYNGNMLTVTNSIFSGNTAVGGGGIDNNGTLMATNSIFSGNTALDIGGGIFSDQGTLTVTNSTLSGNRANGGSGGGIEISFGGVTVTNSTLSGNSANNNGGGIDNGGGTLTVTNSTLSGNNTTNSGSGGGIFNVGTLTVTNSTLSGNSSAVNYGGGINILVGTVNLTNTIVAGNIVSDINGTVVSHGHNLIGSTSGTTGITNGTNGDIVNPTPNLGPLADNGGTTPLPDGTFVKTQAITSTSPAFHAGDPNVCTAPFPTGPNSQDERGANFPRSTTACSIGAFEPQSATTTITLSPTTLPNGTVGVAYSQTLTATGGTAPYTFSVTAGTLPTGLSLSTTGTLSGTPTAGRSFTFTVTATDANGFTGSQQYTVTITVTAPTITLSPTTLPNGTISVPYSQQIAASGGAAPYTFTVPPGTLPTGLTLSTTGLLSGTPTAAGSSTFTVTATDSALNSGSQQYTLTIRAAAGPTLRSIALTGPNGTPPPTTLKVGQMVQLTATGTYSDGSTANITTQVQWSATTPTIVKVDATGKVTGESPGTATITATLNGVTQTVTVTVGAPTPIGIAPAPAPASRPSSVGIAPPGSPAPAPAVAPVGR